MADDSLFEFLHMEMVSLILKESAKEGKEIGTNVLENMGYQVGQRLVERLTKDCPRFKDELDTMKFVCKDFWTALYRKQIDNLRTNHLGVYVLQDYKFKLLLQMSSGKQYIEMAPNYLAFPCGLIRGALANLGIASSVTAEIPTMPACKFHIQIHR